ncbi:MAG: response regulator transcription factor [Bacteroidetes bacterium]|nr:response regulator transcription factor [Bacteroidota bacterium]
MPNNSILYVEDEITLAKLVANSLSTEGFRVHLANNARNAIKLHTQHQMDICILDVMLPDIDGFALARQIRTQNPKVPILFLTAKDSAKNVEEGFAAGGNDYLKKPFDLTELILRIRNLLLLTGHLVGNNEKQTVEIGTYVFNPKTMELGTAGFTKTLSYKEVEILRELLKNINNVTPRKDLLYKVWGDDNFFNSRNLDVYIKKLRNYFTNDPKVQIITLKSVGYHFSVSK